MSVETREYDIVDPGVQDAWCEWARKHSIDPNTMLVPGWAERDEDACQVRYLTWHGSPDAYEMQTCDECDHAEHDGTGEVCTVVAVQQLKGKPLPFPV